jgi:hypothetical protein
VPVPVTYRGADGSCSKEGVLPPPLHHMEGVVAALGGGAGLLLPVVLCGCVLSHHHEALEHPQLVPHPEQHAGGREGLQESHTQRGSRGKEEGE